MVDYIGIERIRASSPRSAWRRSSSASPTRSKPTTGAGATSTSQRALASHSPVGVIELMPISDGQLYSFKYVNGHPRNTAAGLLTVTAFGVLADVDTGYPLLLSELTFTTALRTAAMSALAARWMARPGQPHRWR